jgi:excisionase family DNA binding protein
METTVKLEKLTYSVDEAAEVLGVSRSKMYQIIKMDGFPVLALGGRRLVSVKGLARWVEEQTAQA